MNIHKQLHALSCVCTDLSSTVDNYRSACSNLFTELAKQPLTICLCGSLRFEDKFFELAQWLEQQGIITHIPMVFELNNSEYTEEQVDNVKELHLRKIDYSQIAYVIDVDDYIGETTREEMDYALLTGVDIMSLNTDGYDKTYAYEVLQDDTAALSLTINAMQRFSAMKTCFANGENIKQVDVFVDWCKRVGLDVSLESYLLFDAFKAKEVAVMTPFALDRCRVLVDTNDRNTAVYAIRDFMHCSYGDACIWYSYARHFITD